MATLRSSLVFSVKRDTINLTLNPNRRLVLIGLILMSLVRSASSALLSVGGSLSRGGAMASGMITTARSSRYSVSFASPVSHAALTLTRDNRSSQSSIRRVRMFSSADRPPDYSVMDDDDDEANFLGKDEQSPSKERSAFAEKKSRVNEDGGGFYSDRNEWKDERRHRDHRKKKEKKKTLGGGSWSSSWMEKNQRFDSRADDFPNPRKRDLDVRDKQRPDRGYVDRDVRDWRKDGPKADRDKGKKQEQGVGRNFRDDFRGTRVFVQGLPLDASWQDLKDHFRVAGEVVFASVSVDRQTGMSKGCGVVQFETTDMAKNAIKIMRNHPLDGETLYVREDFQEKKDEDFSGPRMGGGGGLRGDRMVSSWRCANEENADMLSEDERSTIINLIKARDAARRRRNYEASDNMREELKVQHGVHVDDRLKLWWNSVDGTVPGMVSEIKGDGRWGAPNSWRQIPTTPENDACVNPELVEALLTQRDIARREKDFQTADALLEEARSSPDGDLYLRIHDESRTWRIWTDEPPPRPVRQQRDIRKSAADQCIDLVSEHDPDKVPEVEMLLKKFPGREYNVLKKLKQRYQEGSE